MINIQEKGSSSGKVSAIRKAFICILGILFCLTLMAGCSSDDEETSANTTNTSEMTETSSDESNDNANDNQ
ncbi:MAG: hypothetical protein LUB61_01430, partial [Eggerthellaceae bacterium]|nr:hypothetical protein [Eggerthellaceae bacterium]